MQKIGKLMYDDFDDYDDFLDDYNDQLDELANREEDAYDLYESELDEIDEYWDRENDDIKNSDIYTDEEMQQILADHEERRMRKKREARERFESERDSIRLDREQMEFDRKMAESDRENDRLLEETEIPTPVYYPQPAPRYERPSLLKRALAFAGAYYLFEKIFSPNK